MIWIEWKKLSQEHKDKISKGNKGKILCSETKKKISNSKKGKICSYNTKLKISNAMKRIDPFRLRNLNGTFKKMSV